MKRLRWPWVSRKKLEAAIEAESRARKRIRNLETWRDVTDEALTTFRKNAVLSFRLRGDKYERASVARFLDDVAATWKGSFEERGVDVEDIISRLAEQVRAGEHLERDFYGKASEQHA